MSGLSALASSVPASAIPASVRKDGKAAEDTYKAALAFETLLVKQLTSSLSDSAALGAGEDGGSGAPAAYRDMVADQMASSIANSGGIGIADDLYKTLRQEQGTK